MNGREVYRFATRIMGKAAKQACEKAGVSLEEVSLLIPHQANIRIIESASDYLKIGQDKVFTNLDKYGNTSAASIPIALCEALESGRIQNKDKVVMVGFGGGLTWASTVMEWGVPMPYRKEEWWYKIWRWFVYRWARVRSVSRRVSRRLEGLVVKNGEEFVPPPAKDKPAKEKATPEKAAPGQVTPEMPEKSTKEKPAPEKVVAKKPAKEKPAPEKVTAGKAAKEKSVPEKAAAEPPATEKPAAETIIAEPSDLPKAVAEKPPIELEMSHNGNGSKPAPVESPDKKREGQATEVEIHVETEWDADKHG
jgi:hypothetical protein